MKVFYITMQFPVPSETFASNDIKMLIAKGIDVQVFSLLRSLKESKKLIHERSLQDVPISNSTISKNLKGIFYGIISFRKTINIIKFIIKNNRKISEIIKSLILLPRILSIYQSIINNKPNVVHLFWGHYPSLIGYLILKYNPEIVLTTFLGAYDLEMKYKPSEVIAKNASKVFTHAQVNVITICDMGVKLDNICVSYRGVDINNLNNKGLLRKKAGRIVCAGRLIESKRIKEVIKIFSKVKNIFPFASLVILGDGPQKHDLQKLAVQLGVSDSIQFKGHVSQKEVFADFLKSEIFIFMSKKKGERLPNVVKEAMLARSICLVSETPGIGELISDGITGYIIKGDIDEVANKISYIFNNKQELIHIGLNARNFIVNHFDIEKTIMDYINVWEDTLVNKKNVL
ncbi:glycosyltransferase family 4 protein [Heliorestis convoluta]|uniref:Glycosyl transferases group 1 family protein n=1 Tax=Heliorestis convoluta TaxID=356322 RepID=A0A5Q2MYX5_9FIRM|nr:glycosyltransferase family 4 protein [Heliorestis convoluta]QGG47201.1 glycosyl transferases group 1 family protein [Heliorestis convoluta]